MPYLKRSLLANHFTCKVQPLPFACHFFTFLKIGYTGHSLGKVGIMIAFYNREKLIDLGYSELLITNIKELEDFAMYETHDDVIKEKKLPRVGQTVRSKKYGTLWRVMEKREVWLNTTNDPETDEFRVLPAIYLCYWKIKKGELPGVGKMLGFAYTLHDTTFEANWEIVSDQ